MAKTCKYMHGQHAAMLHSRTYANTVIHAVHHKHAVYNDIVDSLLRCDNKRGDLDEQIRSRINQSINLLQDVSVTQAFLSFVRS